MSDGNSLVQRIQDFINQHGAANCYIGITADITSRFRQHNLVQDDNVTPRDPRIAWHWGDAGSEQNARSIEKSFVDAYPTISGNPGGGTNPHHVYIYKIVPGVTDENA